ncbi:MAG TPA: hypothetical protein VEP90_05725 [Methylomirabilota bacterium]|nr:hypothetical protein [Methylomirabilota bacterium]
MLIALILVCTVINATCNLDDAIEVLRVPGTFKVPIACIQAAMEYSAQVDYPLQSNQKFIFVCKKNGGEAHAG